MNVLITGGAGYIGSHTAKTLAGLGFVPVAYDNLRAGHQWAVRWGPFVRGDVGDRDLLVRILRERHIQAVIHFAAFAYVGESIHSPADYFRNNSVNSLALLDAMREAGTPSLIFSSTCATYGLPRTDLISEDHPQNPINPYGESKRFVERAVEWYGRAYGIRSVILRYFNAAGADPDGEIGEAHHPETHLIPLAIQAALGQAPRLQVRGVDYPTPDGTAIRDYIHVADLARAHALALEYLLSGAPNAALNLGTGHGHSIREVVRSVERAGGCPVPFTDAARREGDPPRLVAAAALARKVLNWTPAYPELDDIVRHAWNWHAGQGADRVRAQAAE